MMRLVTAALFCALCGPEDGYEALIDDAARMEKLRLEERRAAHEALDAGDYDRSVALARHAAQLEGDIAAVQEKARRCLQLLVPKLVGLLDDEEFSVREEASGRQRRIGAPALPGLLRLHPTLTSAECRCRVDALLGGIRVDGEGRVHQWAIDAAASSEYAPSDWSAKQAVGPPDSAECDSRNAWAAKDADGGLEWLRLKYALPVTMTRIRVHENLTPGGIVAIDVVGPDGVRRRAWEGQDEGASWFEADLKGAVGSELILVIDARKHAGWEEVDAVELIGLLAPDK
jgi:hypothetical protein